MDITRYKIKGSGVYLRITLLADTHDKECGFLPDMLNHEKPGIGLITSFGIAVLDNSYMAYGPLGIGGLTSPRVCEYR